jgi:hypothetical protein
MAQAAYIAAAIAFVQLLIGVAALIGLAYTVRHAKRAALAAEATLKADRAWVSYWEMDPHPMQMSGGTVDLTIDLRWRNTGRSPALNVVLYADYQIVDFNERSIPTFKVLQGDPNGSRGVMSPDKIYAAQPMNLPSAVFERFRQQTVKLAVYSRATYSDVFQKDDVRQTEVCGFYFWRAAEMVAPDGVMRPVLSFIPTGPQNTAT